MNDTPTPRTDAEIERRDMFDAREWYDFSCKLERELAQSQAEAAAMRLALEKFRTSEEAWRKSSTQDFDDPLTDAYDSALAALSTTAGADILERLRMMEETQQLLEADNAVLWRVVKDSCHTLRVTEDDEKDWPKLPSACVCLKAERDSLRAEVERYKKASGFCEKHTPTGGSRNCLVCGCIKLSYALDRICYACEEPNEMEVSSYAVHHQNEDAVVEQVKQIRAEVERLREDVKQCREFIPARKEQP